MRRGKRRRNPTAKKPEIDIYVGLDISLSSPGYAAISVRNRKPTLIKTAAVPTDAKQSDGLRYSLVEAGTVTFVSQYPDPAAVVREDYKRPASKRQGQVIFGAWAAVDTGLQRCGLRVTDEVNASTVKLIVGGHGKADKDEVAAGVRRILRLSDDYVFATDDESDASAIVLTYLIEKGLIDV
ncbi:crossover junction endodeoxyribonuclease RuvC [Paenibacillus sp. NPDC057967]|uniref:crossover junction endodeoxyribonuclease RuvC n=1 Tax=Paenibacillus sp. NPDC057967 TaxID=3346293 RepID=UPI0036DB0F79